MTSEAGELCEEKEILILRVLFLKKKFFFFILKASLTVFTLILAKN